MKKWIALLLAGTMMVGMTACGGGNNEAPADGAKRKCRQRSQGSDLGA